MTSRGSTEGTDKSCVLARLWELKAPGHTFPPASPKGRTESCQMKARGIWATEFPRRAFRPGKVYYQCKVAPKAGMSVIKISFSLSV